MPILSHRALVEVSLDPLSVLGPVPEAPDGAGEWAFAEANAAAERLLGESGRALAGRRVHDLLDPARADALCAVCAEAAARGTPREVELPAPVDGLVRLRCRATPLGEGRVALTVHEAAEPPEAERELERRNALLEATLDAFPDLHFRLDARGTYLDVRGPLDELTCPPAELIGRRVRDAVPPEAAERIEAAAAEARRGGRPVAFEYEIDLGRGPRTYEARVSPMPDGQVVVVARNLTAARTTELALREREAEQAALRRVATTVAAGADPPAVFALVAEEVARLLGADGGTVSRFHDGKAHLVGVWSAPGAQTARITVPSLPLDGETATARAARTGHPARAGAHGGLTGSVAAPVGVGAELWGAVSALSTRPGGLPEGAELRLGRFAELVSLAISNADARDRLAAQATTDPLTGLANHRVFHERLTAEVARAERHERPLSVVMLDLDHFKEVNDRHGHRTGDQVLIEAARRLGPLARAGEVVARIGGEEFGWLLPETDALSAYAAAERARRAIGAVPFDRAGRLTVSAGVCDLTQARTAPELLELADGALYWAKAQGRDAVYLYSAEVVDALSAQDRAERLARSHALSGLRALARAVDARAGMRTGHAERVAALAEGLAMTLDWPAERVALLREAGLLHDVGKIGLPDAALRPPAELGPETRRIARTHPALGAQIAGEVLAPDQAAWIRGHHERWDGAGYPDGLSGPDIPDGARLLALAEAWEGMTAGGGGAPRARPEDALAACRREAGARLAPEAVEALAALAARGDALTAPT